MVDKQEAIRMAQEYYQNAMRLEKEGDFKGAIENYKKSLSINNNADMPFWGWVNMGNAYKNLEYYADAVKCYRNMIPLLESRHDEHGIHYCHYYIMYCKSKMGNYDNEFVSLAEIEANGGDPIGRYGAYGMLSAYYRDAAKNLEEAEKYGVMQLELAIMLMGKSFINHKHLSMICKNLAWVVSAYKSNKYKGSELFYLRKSIEICRKYNDFPGEYKSITDRILQLNQITQIVPQHTAMESRAAAILSKIL